MRYFIYLQYDGTDYHGWQNQPAVMSVQQMIEEKLGILLRQGEPLPIVGAGRTDAGVHARLMVAHFDYPIRDKEISDNEATVSNTEATVSKSLDLDTLTFKLNGLLPPDIAIKKIVPVTDDAHARFSALSRTYRYYITRTKSPYNTRFITRTYYDLDVEMMNHAAAKLFCYSDFTSFAKLHTDVKTNNCNIMQAYWEVVGPGSPLLEAGNVHVGDLVFTIQADRFLRNMVRSVVGTLVQVGRGKLTAKEFAAIIERKDRCQAGDSMPAEGLFLEDVEYPESIFID